MRYFIVIMALLLFNSTAVKSQDSLKNSIAIQIGITRLDFFLGFRYSKICYKIAPFCTAEIGINRSIFQSRFFPKVEVGSTYFFLNKNKIKLGPQLSYAHSILKINASSSHYTNWNEVYVGARLEVGSKIRFTLEANGGLLNERFYNQFNEKKEGVNSLGFNGNIGISYVW